MSIASRLAGQASSLSYEPAALVNLTAACTEMGMSTIFCWHLQGRILGHSTTWLVTNSLELCKAAHSLCLGQLRALPAPTTPSPPVQINQEAILPCPEQEHMPHGGVRHHDEAPHSCGMKPQPTPTDRHAAGINPCEMEALWAAMPAAPMLTCPPSLATSTLGAALRAALTATPIIRRVPALTPYSQHLAWGWSSFKAEQMPRGEVRASPEHLNATGHLDTVEHLQHPRRLATNMPDTTSQCTGFRLAP